ARCGVDVRPGCCIQYSIQEERTMAVRLNITMEEDLYKRLKTELPPKRLSAFINDAVRARLRPDKAALDAGYKAARKDRARQALATEWQHTETEGWPE